MRAVEAVCAPPLRDVIVEAHALSKLLDTLDDEVFQRLCQLEDRLRARNCTQLVWVPYLRNDKLAWAFGKAHRPQRKKFWHWRLVLQYEDGVDEVTHDLSREERAEVLGSAALQQLAKRLTAR